MRLLRWQKPQARPVKRDIFPGKRHFFPSPQALHNVQRLLQFRDAVLTPQTHGLEFLLTVAQRHAEIQTPVRNVVERRDIFSDFDRVEQRQK